MVTLAYHMNGQLVGATLTLSGRVRPFSAKYDSSKTSKDVWILNDPEDSQKIKLGKATALRHPTEFACVVLPDAPPNARPRA